MLQAVIMYFENSFPLFIASIPGNIFLALHEKLHIMLKGRLGTLNVHEFTVQLTEELHEQLENLGTHGTMDLNKLVR